MLLIRAPGRGRVPERVIILAIIGTRLRAVPLVKYCSLDTRPLTYMLYD